MNTNPLILTLTLDKASAEYFTSLRDQYFPPERNFLMAHLTLFHKLPPEEPKIIETLSAISLEQQQLNMEVIGLVGLGFGVAFKVENEELLDLHRSLQQEWQGFLSPQDKQKLRPHITIQNKVKPEVAKALASKLSETFEPFTIKGTGFTLWEYRGGPWSHYKDFPFKERAI